MKKIVVILILFIICSQVSKATTWYSIETVCPICKTECTFQAWSSYGNYVYQWPSKFQLVFWPWTENQSVYCCRKCNFTAFMGDFAKVPESRIDSIKTMLDSNKIDQEFTDYQSVAMTVRLEQAAKYYTLSGKDDSFFCEFYRLLGYHYEEEGLIDEAIEARNKTYQLAEKMKKDPENTGKEKEYFFIMASMSFYSGNKEQALVLLDSASSYTFSFSKHENASDHDEYLTGVISEFVELINKGSGKNEDKEDKK